MLYLLLEIFLPARVALADTSPKPSMEFEFSQEFSGEPVTILSGRLYECDRSDCADAAPLEEFGPQRFTCGTESCRALAYGFTRYHRLEIKFSDGRSRQSNIFETAGFSSRYTVTIRPDDLLVAARFRLDSFAGVAVSAAACVCGLIGISLLAGLIVLAARRTAKA